MERRVSWPFFSERELACPHCGEVHMDAHFMGKLVDIRRDYGRPMIVTSAYRCPEYNKEISSTGLNGPHTTGKAIDIHVYGTDAHDLLNVVTSFRMQGIGLKQHGPYKGRFIHMDEIHTGNRPWIWTYK